MGTGDAEDAGSASKATPDKTQAPAKAETAAKGAGAAAAAPLKKPAEAPAEKAPAAKAPAAKAATAPKAKLAPPAERIDAAIKAGKLDDAAAVLATEGETLLLDGEESRLVAWFEAIGDGPLQGSPQLLLLSGWAFVFTQQYRAALSRAGQAQRALTALQMSKPTSMKADPDAVNLTPYSELDKKARALRAHLAWASGDVPNLPTSPDEIMLPASADHPVWRASALLTLGRCHLMAGSLAAAALDLDAAIAGAQVSHTRRARRIASDARIALGQVREYQADLDAAQALYEKVSEDTGSEDAFADERDAAIEGLGRVACARGDLAAANELFAKGLARAEVSTLPMSTLSSLLTHAHVLADLDDAEGSAAALKRAEAVARTAQQRVAEARVGLHRALLAVKRGELGAAQRWASQLSMQRETASGPLHEKQQLTAAWIHLAAGQGKSALDAVAAVHESATEAGRAALVIEAEVLDALLKDAAGRKAHAAEALAKAVATAAPTGYRWPFVAGGAALGALLEHAAPRLDAGGRKFAEAVRASLGLEPLPAKGGAKAAAKKPSADVKAAAKKEPGADAKAPADASKDAAETAKAEAAPKAGAEATTKPAAKA